MPRVSMTDRFVNGAKAQAGQARTSYFDSVTKSLELIVSAKSKTWFFHFRTPNGKKGARVKLGTYPATSLAAARGLAVEARGLVEAGKDARDAFASRDAAAMTVADLVGSYMEKHVKPNLRSAAHVQKRFAGNVLPIIGSVRIADLHRRDLNRVLDPIIARGAMALAGHVFSDLRALLRWAVARGDIDHSPMTGMNKPVQPAPRERVLTDTEIETLWNGLPNSLAKSPTCQRIVKLCLVTGQRVGEISGMRRDELDLKARIWSLPGSRTKNGRAHSVALSDLAITIIEEALEAAGKKSLFVFPIAQGSMRPHAVARAIGRAQEADEDRPHGRFGIPERWTCHDLRRSALTGMARLGVAPIVLGHVANHLSTTKAGVTLGVYIKHGYERECREALEMWSDRLRAIVAGQGATIIPLRA